jgi:integrase
MKMPKVNLTQKFIDNNLFCPERQRKIEFCDTLVPGLRVDVTETSPGKGTFFYSRKIDGKRSHMKISSTLDMNLKDAREYAKNLRAEYQLGGDPYAAAKAKKQVITWSQYWKTIYLPHIKVHLRSWMNLVSLNEKYLEPHISHLALNTISLELATKLHRDMVEEKGLSHASADHMAKLLRQAMNHAVRLNLLSTSPVSKIRLFNVDNREERLMSDNELQRLMAVLDTDHNRMVCMVVKWLLLTGARVNSEALQARWTDIDRENRTWLILATNSKSKQRRAVPLNDAAMAVLDQLGTEGQSEWLFTSSKGGGRLTTISKPWLRIRKVANLPHCRLHDLRHMHASMLVNSGRTLYEVQQILGHSDPSVTQRYAHLSTATLQDAAASVGKYVADALEKTGK